MNKSIERISCRTPTPGKQPTSIPRWKFDLLRKHLLALVPPRLPGIPSRQIPALLKTRLKASDLEALGSISWHVTTVKLELEVRGELKRIEGVSPQRLLRLV